MKYFSITEDFAHGLRSTEDFAHGLRFTEDSAHGLRNTEVTGGCKPGFTITSPTVPVALTHLIL